MVSFKTSIFKSQPNIFLSNVSFSFNSKQASQDDRYLVPEEKSKYKFMEHKANDKNHNIDMMETRKADSDRQEKRSRTHSSKNLQKDGAASGKTPSPSVLPDYFSNYFTILSSEQRLKATYHEYYTFHCKMLNLSRPINDLQSKRKLISPGSKEYQDTTEKLTLIY